MVLNEWRVRWEKAHPPIDEHVTFTEATLIEFGSINHLAFESGISARRIRKITGIEQKIVTFKVAEKLLMAIDRDYMLQTGEVPVIPNPLWSREKWHEWRSQEGGACTE